MTAAETTWQNIMDRYRHLVQWPDGRVAAATVGVALEAFDNQSQLRLAGEPGRRDEFSLSYGKYGVRVGVWRLLEVFDEYDIKASFSISGRLAEEWPDVVTAVALAGHDVVGHGWVNDMFMTDADPDAERSIVTRTLDAIEKASGVRPVGWASPANSSSKRTRKVLTEARILWTGDDASDDLPYVMKVDDASLVVLPKTNLAANDLIHWVLPTNSPAVFAEGFRDALAVAIAEGRTGRPQWADMVLHCHMAGRPAFIPTLRRCLERARAEKDVWWTTKTRLAEWTLENGFVR